MGLIHKIMITATAVAVLQATAAVLQITVILKGTDHE